MNRKTPMNEKASILVIKIQPDNVEQPVTGLVVCLSGFAMDRSLANIMYSLLSNETNNKVFLQKTGACNHCFDANIVTVASFVLAFCVAGAAL